MVPPLLRTAYTRSSVLQLQALLQQGEVQARPPPLHLLSFARALGEPRLSKHLHEHILARLALS